MSTNRRLAPGWAELTPVSLRCGIGVCPGIYKAPGGSYVIVGRMLSADEARAALPNRVGAHETAVEIDPAFIDGLLARQ